MRTFLFVWLAGAIVSFILHFFYPEIISNLSFWNKSLGWQREIALWNLSISLIIIYALIKRNIKFYKDILVMLVIISFVMGTNHLFELIINRKIILTNLSGAVLNLVMALWGWFILKNGN